MNPLEPPDNMYLQAAQGWLELGNHIEADSELDRIAPEYRTHPDVLDLRWHIYAHDKRWEECIEIAAAFIRIHPDCPSGWLHRAFALHELKRTQEALDQLLPVADRFPKVWTIPYNLACYYAQLGRLDHCEAWFKKAMIINEHSARRAAVDDPDLKPLWDRMSGST